MIAIRQSASARIHPGYRHQESIVAQDYSFYVYLESPSWIIETHQRKTLLGCGVESGCVIDDWNRTLSDGSKCKSCRGPILYSCTMLSRRLMITIRCFDESDIANRRVVSAENAGCTIVAAASKIRVMHADRRIMSVLLRENRIRGQFSADADNHCQALSNRVKATGADFRTHFP